MKKLQFINQPIIPAARHQKDIEKICQNANIQYFVMLESHIAQLKPLLKLAQRNHKKVLLHADLIAGLKNDDYGVEFLCQEVRPAGIISTRANVVAKAKQQGVFAIQRLFMIDSSAYEKGISFVEKIKPDAIELLPGIIPTEIKKMTTKVSIPIIAGGLITTKKQIDQALAAGAKAITTSNKELWSKSLLKGSDSL
ncbi:glycerol-3-phosphate responsive antiterminator [Listeria sp. PSOL-1]|uniref:glycerol-3-phosphate responsive antiterminator n=1 Tax=Listeria sp. PSOL-1 TaxID=1844999 RepID=UPI0013D682F5|nr:glycerol-3-phosphate responsive antiterminator [Listeria sp. PSOL-1]